MKSRDTDLPPHSVTNNYENITSNLDKGANFLDLSDIYLTRDQLSDLAERVANNSFIGHIIWGRLPQDAGAVVGQIEDKLIENNKLYKTHPTDFTHALLSSHSYKTSEVGNRVEFTVDSKGAPHVNAKYNQYLEDWRVEKVFKPKNADDYYSVLYVNDKTHHAVLAHRGTDIPSSLKGKNASLKADLIEILNHNIGVQQAASYVSTKEALDISNSLGYNFSTTGHSLGAWLAELSLYFCHMDFDYHQVKAVTFDSPGSKDQMDVFKSNVHNDDTKIRTNQFDMVTYLSAPNIVNVCNQHVGKVYRLAPEIKYPEALKKELPAMLPKFVKNIIAENKYYLDSLLSVSGHSLSPMLDVFDPETGKPYPDKYALVLDWPRIKHTANTQPVQRVVKEILIDNIPVIGSLPNFLKEAGVKALNKLVPSSTIGSVSTVIASFLGGDTNILQLCETFRHFDLNTHDKGYEVKADLNSQEQFSLSYEGHYRTKGVNPLQDKLLTKYKGSIDWYLSQVAKTPPLILEKGLDEISYKQLSIIKHGFKTEHINGENHVSLINQHQHNIKSIEQFKGYLLRLTEVNPKIKEFLEDRSIKHSQLVFDNNSNVIANDLPHRINNFVGREDIFQKLDKILQVNQTVAINAFAGTGKSSTALEYAHLQCQGGKVKEGKIVRWFNADSVDKVKAHYRELASDLGVNIEQQEQRIVINSVNSAIVKLGKPMLLILDNLENYQDAQEYLVNLPKKLVQVVITTRDSNMLDNHPGQHITLEPFSNEDAAIYISSSLQSRVNSQDIEELIKLLGNKEGEIIPYRLAKAVGFLKENKLWSVSKYIKHIKDNPNIEQAETKLLIESLQGADSVSVYGLQILQYAAFLDPDSMSIEIFKELLNIDEEQLQESIAKLEKLSLVSLNHQDDMAYLKIHRLAQDEIIRYINSNQNQEQQQLLTRPEIQQNLIVSLNNLMPKVTSMNNQGDWQVGGLYYPHIQKILDSAKQIMLAETGELYCKLGEYSQYALCNYKQSLDQYLEALKTYQAVYVKEGNHPDIARSLNNVGLAYGNLGQEEKGLQYKEQALTMYQALYQGNHPDIAASLNNVGGTYGNLGNKFKALELYKQCYFMRCKLLGKDDSGTEAAMSNIISLDKKFSGLNEDRINILDRGIVNQEILAVEHKIQKKVLNKIYELAGKGDWSSGALLNSPSILGDWGTKRYLSEKFLKKSLGKLSSAENIKIAQMLCFEAMCLGVMNSKKKDFNCIKEFAKAYPELLSQIIAEHPEYMVDGSIVKICVNDPTTLTRLLGENFSGQGNGEHEAADPWMEYTKIGMDELLTLRLEAADQMDVKTIMPNYVYDGSKENAKKLANEISNNLGEKSLIVLNLFGKHWVGLVIEKDAETIDIQYMDSEQEIMPSQLQESLISQVAQDFPQHNIQVTTTELESQKYNNCGPEVIENITSHLLGWGRTTSQEDAVAIHSVLLEDSLMSGLMGETSYHQGNIGLFNPPTSLHINSGSLLLENG